MARGRHDETAEDVLVCLWMCAVFLCVCVLRFSGRLRVVKKRCVFLCGASRVPLRRLTHIASVQYV